MKFPTVISVLILSSILQILQAEKILVLSFFATKSHKITYMGLIEELAARGHEITIVTPVKASKPVKNIREIFTFDIQPLFNTGDGDGKSFDPFKRKELNQNVDPMILRRMVLEVCTKSYEFPEVMALVNEKYDLIFLQPMFNECAFGIIHRLKAPVVLFYPTTIPSFGVNKLGGHFPPSFVGNVMLGYTGEMTFMQRFFNFGVELFIETVYKYYMQPPMEAIYREKLGNDIPSIEEIYANVSLMLSNGHFSVSGPKPYLPDVIDVGGIHSKPAKPLPKDLEDFVSKSGKDGFILFSMGSAIKGSDMPDEKRNMFLNVFSKLKQQVLWKWESETMPNLPKNVKLSKWLPQQDLLGHPNIKMFITHCGGGSTEEAIYHGVPLLGIPMFADQPQNAELAKSLGFIVDLEWNKLTEATLLDGINKILQDPKYRDNVTKISTLFKDQINDPLERGVYWVEYVLRHKGAPHLRSPARKLNFIQYHSWDVMAVYFAIIFATLYIIFVVIRFIARNLCCGSKKTFTNVNQNKKQN